MNDFEMVYTSYIYNVLMYELHAKNDKERKMIYLEGNLSTKYLWVHNSIGFSFVNTASHRWCDDYFTSIRTCGVWGQGLELSL